MEFLIPIKDIVIGPGKSLDPSATPENEVIALIKKAYGFLAKTMEVSIHEEMVRIKFKDATPEKINEAQAKLEKAIKEAQQGRLLKAMSLNPGHPHTYFGLALLYRIAGHLEESLSVIEKLIATIPKTQGDDSPVYREAEELYREIKKELTDRGTVH